MKEAIIIFMLLIERYCCLLACSPIIDVSIHLFPNYAQNSLLTCCEKHRPHESVMLNIVFMSPQYDRLGVYNSQLRFALVLEEID